jgi:NADH-quinone oxidoreductase subunit C
MTDALKELGEYIAQATADAVTGVDIARGELTLLARADRLVPLITFLRDDGTANFKLLVDICGVDWPARTPRFDVVYHLLSLSQNQRCRVKVQTDEDTPVPSITGVYSAAGWFEREAWDMYGILFSGHPDLRRILTDYGFEGHPLRKDFPLTGHVELRYDEAQKRVVYEPVTLPQEFRRFDFLSPWEGARAILPGDEKATAAEDEPRPAKGKD